MRRIEHQVERHAQLDRPGARLAQRGGRPVVGGKQCPHLLRIVGIVAVWAECTHRLLSHDELGGMAIVTNCHIRHRTPF